MKKPTKKEVAKIITHYGYKAEYCGNQHVMFIVYNETLIRARQNQGTYFNDQPVCKCEQEHLLRICYRSFRFMETSDFSIKIG